MSERRENIVEIEKIQEVSNYLYSLAKEDYELYFKAIALCDLGIEASDPEYLGEVLEYVYIDFIKSKESRLINPLVVNTVEKIIEMERSGRTL